MRQRQETRRRPAQRFSAAPQAQSLFWPIYLRTLRTLLSLSSGSLRMAPFAGTDGVSDFICRAPSGGDYASDALKIQMPGVTEHRRESTSCNYHPQTESGCSGRMEAEIAPWIAPRCWAFRARAPGFCRIVSKPTGCAGMDRPATFPFQNPP